MGPPPETWPSLRQGPQRARVHILCRPAGPGAGAGRVRGRRRVFGEVLPGEAANGLPLLVDTLGHPRRRNGLRCDPGSLGPRGPGSPLRERCSRCTRSPPACLEPLRCRELREQGCLRTGESRARPRPAASSGLGRFQGQLGCLSHRSPSCGFYLTHSRCLEHLARNSGKTSSWSPDSVSHTLGGKSANISERPENAGDFHQASPSGPPRAPTHCALLAWPSAAELSPPSWPRAQRFPGAPNHVFAGPVPSSLGDTAETGRANGAARTPSRRGEPVPRVLSPRPWWRSASRAWAGTVTGPDLLRAPQLLPGGAGSPH